MADFCVHWFRLAHDALKPGARAGLVGTKTITQNESRKASLDYVVNHGGTITEAIATQVWPGEAVVRVCIVNWLKGKAPGLKKIFTQLGDAKGDQWKCEEVDSIGPTLKATSDVTDAKTLHANQKPSLFSRDKNPVHEGFFLTPQEAAQMIKQDRNHREILFPYMIGRDLVEEGKPTRWIIDLDQLEMTEAMQYGAAFERVKKIGDA